MEASICRLCNQLVAHDPKVATLYDDGKWAHIACLKSLEPDEFFDDLPPDQLNLFLNKFTQEVMRRAKHYE